MFLPQFSLLIIIKLISNVIGEVGYYRPVPDTARICIATYIKHLDNELLLGTWYYVYHFAPWLNLPASGECREFVLKRPTQRDMDMYKAAYNLTGMPYTFNEDAILFNDTRKEIYSGLVLGKREAKFFLYYPSKHGVYRESYDVVLIRYINENYVLYEQCTMRGNSKWLMSKMKHPSDEELQKIISSQSDLMSLQNQKYCAKQIDPYDM